MKKALALISVFLLIATVFASVPAFAATVNYGDVDGNGSVNATDCAYLARHVAGWTNYKTVNTANSDVYSDGKIDPRDVVVLLRNVANWDGYKTLPVTPTEAESDFVPGIW